MGLIRSRIHEFITPEVMKKLKSICNDVTISENNVKVNKIKQVLDEHEVPYNSLGPGTNRMAVLIDGYVFKIAMDKWGVRDNNNEFAMSELLQPFVITVYETNGLIAVTEYVTLISREEFTEKKIEILKILHELSQSYLLGDVGYHPKNFTNWGYRTNGELVILDFAYIYNIVGDELLCSHDGNLLNYDENFHNLRCPHCKRKYTFMDIRRKVTREQEDKEINLVKESSYAVTQAVTMFKDEEPEEVKKLNNDEEVKEMSKEYTEEELNQMYDAILDVFQEETVTLEDIEERKTAKMEIVQEPIVIDDDEDPLESIANLMSGVYNGEEPEIEEEEEDEELEEEDIRQPNLIEQFLEAHADDESDETTSEEPLAEIEPNAIVVDVDKVIETAPIEVEEEIDEPIESVEVKVSVPIAVDTTVVTQETVEVQNTIIYSTSEEAVINPELQKLSALQLDGEKISDTGVVMLASEYVDNDASEEVSEPVHVHDVQPTSLIEEKEEYTEDGKPVFSMSEINHDELDIDDEHDEQEENHEEGLDDSDLFALAAAKQAHEEITDEDFEEVDKHELLAEQHLGRDPYEY